MRTCYYCNSALTNRNRTAEHVIPNALGGRLVSYKLLCRSCNIELGETVDAALVRQFEELTRHLNLTRDRKKRTGDRRRHLGKAPAVAETEQRREDAVGTKDTDGKIALQGIAKIAIAMYLHRGGEQRYIQKAVAFLKGEQPNDRTVGPFPKAQESNDGADKMKHSIQIAGSPVTGSLQAYIVLFDEYAFSVNMNNEYGGAEVAYQYEVEL